MSRRNLAILLAVLLCAGGVVAYVASASKSQASAPSPAAVEQPPLAGARTEPALALHKAAIEQAEKVAAPTGVLPTFNPATQVNPPPVPEPAQVAPSVGPQGKIGVAFTAHVNGETEPCG